MLNCGMFSAKAEMLYFRNELQPSAVDCSLLFNNQLSSSSNAQQSPQGDERCCC